WEAPDETVRQAAIHAAALWRDREAVPALVQLLKSPSRHNRRAAAEALGRIGDFEALPALFDALAEDNDRALEHSLTYPLIQIGDRGLTTTGAMMVSPKVRRACLIALDQMTDGRLEARRVAVYLSSTNPVLKEAAVWIAGRHPEWGGELAGHFRERLAANLSAGE